MNAELELADAVHILGLLFLGSPDHLECDDAADANDDGCLNVSDPVYTLVYLFAGGAEPPPPFGACGEDLTPDELGCDRFDPCSSLAPAPPLLTPPPSPTRAAAVALTGTTLPGLLVRITGGSSPEPVEIIAGPSGAFQASVTLGKNRLNRIFALVIDGARRPSAPAVVDVIQDSEPPFVFIDEPTSGGVFADRLTVAGRVADTLSGFRGLTVTVDGEPADVAIGIGTNGTFERRNVPLEIDSNVITATATDAVGNTATYTTEVIRIEPPVDSARLEIVSGDRQAPQPIHTLLAAPIVVRARGPDGRGIKGRLVTFRVTRSDGRLSGRRATPPEKRVMVLGALTDADGLATAHWTLGGDAGCGNHRVKASSPGLGEVSFFASAEPGPPVSLNVGSGNDQRGEVGSPARDLLRAWVTDGCNGVPGVPVTFRVTRGGGKVDGTATVTVPSGPTGHAQASFVFGPQAGNQVVEANFADNFGSPAIFVAHALRRDESRPTTFKGLLLDNATRPIGGAVCLLEVPGFEGVQARTTIDGRFTLEAPGAGPASLTVEGSAATHAGGESVPPGSFPALTYEVTLVPNAENSLPSPVKLPPLDPQNAVEFTGDSDAFLTVQGLEGFEVYVPFYTTVTLRDGTKVGPENPGSVRLSLNIVHQDDVPMPMPDGAAPPFAWTLQPRGARFDPPLAVQYPNALALPAGAVANVLTFNHDTGKFEIVSSGRVAADGSTIQSDPGSGISVAGWGGICPPYPTPEDVGKDPEKDCALSIDGVDSHFAPGLETLGIKYSLSEARPFAKLEVFRASEFPPSPLFVDFSIPRSAASHEYSPGWDGRASLGPTAGKLIGPGIYSARISVANLPDFSDGCSKSKLFKVEVHSIALSLSNGTNINKGEFVGGWTANPGEGIHEIRAAVKLKKKDDTPAATPVPIEVTWTFTDIGDPNATAAESHAYASDKKLGKRNDPDARYWSARPDSPARSEDDFKLTAASETIVSGADLGTAKIEFRSSGVGGDDFVVKAAVKSGASTLAEQESGDIVVIRLMTFERIYEMQGFTHASKNAVKAKIQPYFNPTFVAYFDGAVNAIPPELSVKYIGLYKDAATPQLSWEELQKQSAVPRKLRYGPYAESEVDTEIPTEQEKTDSEYAGVDPVLVARRKTAREAITKKAQAWVERIDSANIAARSAWFAAAGIPDHAMVAIQYIHPKYSLKGGDWETKEWPPWVTVTAEFGIEVGVDPDAGFVAGGLSVGGFANFTTGIVTLPDGFPDAVNVNIIAHEVGHASKAVFPRQEFGPNLDHSQAPGLMDPNSSLYAFTAREIKILRGYTQP